MKLNNQKLKADETKVYYLLFSLSLMCKTFIWKVEIL